ncbi:MAG: hypothetical protein II745_01260 [Lachnospiraceae bacterium]|jgi:hypothetical protein|nr:hypothetical protein [Lachnospiraceae bacterium]
MSVFPFPGVATLVGIILILTVRYRYLSKKQKAKEESYYELEKRADQTPAKDLSTLPYIKVPVDSFPFGFSDDPEVCLIEEEILELSRKPLLNLSRKSNTTLKLEYGARNLKKMQVIADDYDRLVVLLCDYAKILMENEMTEEAFTVLSFGEEIGSDVSQNAVLLRECKDRLNIHCDEPDEDPDGGEPKKDRPDEVHKAPEA